MHSGRNDTVYIWRFVTLWRKQIPFIRSRHHTIHKVACESGRFKISLIKLINIYYIVCLDDYNGICCVVRFMPLKTNLLKFQHKTTMFRLKSRMVDFDSVFPSAHTIQKWKPNFKNIFFCDAWFNFLINDFHSVNNSTPRKINQLRLLFQTKFLQQIFSCNCFTCMRSDQPKYLLFHTTLPINF